MLCVIDSINEITKDQLKEICKIGFCYVQLPNATNTEADLTTLRSHALDFFRLSKKEKKCFAVKNNLEGFADRQDGKMPQSIQQFFFRPHKPIGPFVADHQLIARVAHVFQNEIALPLVWKIFEITNQEDKFIELTAQPFSSFSFVYYPKAPEKKCIRGVAAHKDFDLITVLQVTKEGLQVWFENKWIDIYPMPGYVVVNFANALELMLAGACTSALHRVLLPQEERLSIGLFVGPDMGAQLEKPVKNLLTGEILFDSYAAYLEQQFEQQYEEPNLNFGKHLLVESSA